MAPLRCRAGVFLLRYAERCHPPSDGRMEVVIHLPDDIALRLQARWGDVARYVLECVARAWYQSGELNYPAASCEVSNPRLHTVMAPPVWRGRCSCILCRSCMRILEQPQLDVLAMQLRIAFCTAGYLLKVGQL